MTGSVWSFFTKPIRPRRGFFPFNVLEFNQGPGHTESGQKKKRRKKKTTESNDWNPMMNQNPNITASHEQRPN